MAGCTQCREPSYTVSILIHMDNIDNDNKNYKMFAFSLFKLVTVVLIALIMFKGMWLA